MKHHMLNTLLVCSLLTPLVGCAANNSTSQSTSIIEEQYSEIEQSLSGTWECDYMEGSESKHNSLTFSEGKLTGTYLSQEIDGSYHVTEDNHLISTTTDGKQLDVEIQLSTDGNILILEPNAAVFRFTKEGFDPEASTEVISSWIIGENTSNWQWNSGTVQFTDSKVVIQSNNQTSDFYYALLPEEKVLLYSDNDPIETTASYIYTPSRNSLYVKTGFTNVHLKRIESYPDQGKETVTIENCGIQITMEIPKSWEGYYTLIPNESDETSSSFYIANLQNHLDNNHGELIYIGKLRSEERKQIEEHQGKFHVLAEQDGMEIVARDFRGGISYNYEDPLLSEIYSDMYKDITAVLDSMTYQPQN